MWGQSRWLSDAKRLLFRRPSTHGTRSQSWLGLRNRNIMHRQIAICKGTHCLYTGRAGSTPIQQKQVGTGTSFVKPLAL